MKTLLAPFRFLWGFVVGDQPLVAAGVVATLVVAWLLHGFWAVWIVVPILVAVLLIVSLMSLLRTTS
ncbi:MAG: hypothetical protein ACYDHP_13925 [Ferrimicrobium sp.]